MNVSELEQGFILHFGEMGSHWGINRTVGQVYALLYLSEPPLNADEITEKLGISRSNTSMSLKELQSWRLVRLHHQPGDRRDYFSVPDDIWEIVRVLAEERKKREIDPTLTFLRRELLAADATPENAHAIRRLNEMHETIETFSTWYDDVQRLETKRLIELLSLGSGVIKLLEFTDKLPKKLQSLTKGTSATQSTSDQTKDVS